MNDYTTIYNNEETPNIDLRKLMYVNDLDHYQSRAKSTSIFPKDQALYYLSLKLCGEAGEVADKVGKFIRDGGVFDDVALAKELGDVLWYIAVLSDWLGYDLSEIADMNLKKLKDRADRNVISGSGDNR